MAQIAHPTVSQDNAHMIIARYVLCCMKPDLQHKTLAMADCDYSKVVIAKRICGAETHFTYYPLKSRNNESEIQLRRQTAQNQRHSLPLFRELHSYRTGSTPDDAGEIRHRLLVSIHQDARLRQALQGVCRRREHPHLHQQNVLP